MASMIALALALWGWILPVHIDTATVEDPPCTPGCTVAWATERYTIDRWDGTCVISLTSRFEELPPAEKQTFITHEVGHCLGLDHIEHPGLMQASPLGYTFSVWDRIEFWRVHPAPYKVTFPMVAN